MRSNDFWGDNASAATCENMMADRGDFAALGSEGDVVQAGEMVADSMGVEENIECVFKVAVGSEGHFVAAVDGGIGDAGEEEPGEEEVDVAHALVEETAIGRVV